MNPSLKQRKTLRSLRLAMRIDSSVWRLRNRGLGANEKRQKCSHKNCKNKEKKAVLNSVWLKEVIKRKNIYKLNKYNNINHV
jgi:hypothetical protein